MAPVARSVYSTKKLRRLDQILNHLGIKQSENNHPNFDQRTVRGKLVINPCPFATDAYDAAESMFAISIDVWVKQRKNCRNEWRQTRVGTTKNKTTISLHRNVD